MKRDIRDKVLALLKDYAILHMMSGDTNRSNAYVYAHGVASQLRSILSLEAVEDLPGFGPGIMGRLREMVQTGSVRELNAWKARNRARLAFVDRVMRIPGVGIRHAIELYDNSGVRAVSDLRRLLPPHQADAVRYLRDLGRPIDPTEIEDHTIIITQALRDVDPDAQVWLTDGKAVPAVADLNYLVSSTAHGVLNDLVQRLSAMGYTRLTVANGRRHRSLICRVGRGPHRRVDIKFATEHELPFALLHYTIPVNITTKLRRIAAERGLKLNEKGLFERDTNKRIEGFLKVKDILDFLGVPVMQR